jgi:hypothetical protein
MILGIIVSPHWDNVPQLALLQGHRSIGSLTTPNHMSELGQGVVGLSPVIDRNSLFTYYHE